MPDRARKSKGKEGKKTAYDDLKWAAEERIREFSILSAAQPPCYAGAAHAGRLAVELLLKCAICRRLDKNELHSIFYHHDLDELLYFTGLKDRMFADEDRKIAFERLDSYDWNKLRYGGPFEFTKSSFATWESWLNGKGDPVDHTKGLISWLKEQIP